MLPYRKVLFIALALIVTLHLASGCSAPQKRSEPPLPTKVAGWKYHEEFGVGIVGEFVLKKGEETNNGKIKIKLINIIPGDPDVEPQTYYYQARASLQFSRMSGDELCRDEFLEKSTLTFHSGKCGESLDKFWLRGVSVYSINTVDGWVHFGIVGSKSD
jgi:hypothetical protein